MSPTSLPLPRLERREIPGCPGGALALHADDGVFRHAGIRIGFTERAGGSSEGPFASLNLSPTVGDAPEDAQANITALCAALGIDEARLIRPNQVHGTELVIVDGAEGASWNEARASAAAGVDGVVVAADGVGALLCFADCAPVIVVSPTGAFAVAHAGWRGAVAGIAGDAVRALARHDMEAGAFPTAAEAAAAYNAYIGPYIHAECFETGPDVRERFVERYGAQCAPDESHVDLGCALRVDLKRAGIASERIADVELCTSCNADRFFSYRASGGTCGRHGAIACRTEGGAR